ncbi:MAG TPA: hypothetical protein DCG13_04415 [Legionellales bacterium]|nr:hypothetical protein [Legionellales bacterium]HCA88871.1 hypothetical protein [Legionellales bacterium]|tara:strand:- start:4236 stop:4910 length:675 start_codon:yes stop_codon:yes gene_type:complete
MPYLYTLIYFLGELISDPTDFKKTEPEKKEIKLSKLGLFISVFFATLATFIITAARLPAGVIAYIALGFNALSEIARVGYGLLQLSFHSLRKVIGIALGVLFVGLNTISHALNLIFVAISTLVRVVRPLIGFIIAGLVVIFQGIRNVLAGIIALLLATVVGVFAGRQKGIDAFNAIYNFLHVEDKLTDIFSQIFKKLMKKKASLKFLHILKISFVKTMTSLARI